MRPDQAHVAVARVHNILVGGAALGDALMGDVGQSQHGFLSLFLRGLQAGILLLDLRRDSPHLRELAGKLGRILGKSRHRGIGRLLCRAQVLDRLELGAPRSVGGEDGVEVHVQVLAGDRRPDELGGFADQFGVKHGGIPLCVS